MNWHRLMWANDFPHSDSTWPWSQEMLDEQASNLTVEQRRAILCDNAAELYGIDTSALPVGGDALAETPAAQTSVAQSSVAQSSMAQTPVA
jgi:hypothetical protein